MRSSFKLVAGAAVVAAIVAIIACQVANTPATDAPPSSPPAPEPMPAEAPAVAAEPAAEPATSGVMPDLREAGSAALRADGAACSEANQCANGICESEGCGEEQDRCAAKAAPCTRDLVTYCGCDGKTFQASGSCARKRYAHRGACGESGAK